MKIISQLRATAAKKATAAGLTYSARGTGCRCQ